jgi:hypothetical protein
MNDLAKEVGEVRDASLGRVRELHDDYFHTSWLWQELLVRQRYGHSSSVRNAKTGNVTAAAAEWTERARTSSRRLRVRTFKDLAGQLELFIGDFLRVWLLAHPKLLEEKAITLATLLDSTDLAETRQRAIREACESAILKRLLGKPASWFSYLKSLVGSRISAADGEAFAEHKAARDVLEHHDGIVDEGYLRNAGKAARYASGDLIEPGDAAIDDLYDLVTRLIHKIAADAERKISRPSTGHS